MRREKKCQQAFFGQRLVVNRPLQVSSVDFLLPRHLLSSSTKLNLPRLSSTPRTLISPPYWLSRLRFEICGGGKLAMAALGNAQSNTTSTQVCPPSSLSLFLLFRETWESEFVLDRFVTGLYVLAFLGSSIPSDCDCVLSLRSDCESNLRLRISKMIFTRFAICWLNLATSNLWVSHWQYQSHTCCDCSESEGLLLGGRW